MIRAARHVCGTVAFFWDYLNPFRERPDAESDPWTDGTID